MDKSTIKIVAKLHPELRSEVASILIEIQSKGIDIKIVQGLRSFKEQDAIYAQGRALPGKIVSNAKGGQSYHNFGLALDFCLLHKDGSISWDINEDSDKDNIEDWNEVVDVFESYGWSSGTKWKHPDNPHFEKTFGYNFKQFAKFKKDKEGYVIL